MVRSFPVLGQESITADCGLVAHWARICLLSPTLYIWGNHGVKPRCHACCPSCSMVSFLNNPCHPRSKKGKVLQDQFGGYLEGTAQEQ